MSWYRLDTSVRRVLRLSGSILTDIPRWLDRNSIDPADRLRAAVLSGGAVETAVVVVSRKAVPAAVLCLGREAERPPADARGGGHHG
jgi:hypothetical protein